MTYDEFVEGNWRTNLRLLSSGYVDQNTMDEAGDMMTGFPERYPLFDWTLSEALAAVLRGDETVLDSIQGGTRAGDLAGAEGFIRELQAAYEAHKLNMRRAIPSDVPAIAALYRASQWHNLPDLPDTHTREEDLAFFGGQMLPNQIVWVIEDGNGGLAAYAAGTEGRLNHLFVHPEMQGRRLGTRLLEEFRVGTKVLDLWTFQANARARAFYERKGFVAVEFTDGECNEEKTPDVRYEWRRL